MARRAGCGVAAEGGVIDGCCAAYTSSVTFGDSFSSRRSLCAFGAVNNNLLRQFAVAIHSLAEDALDIQQIIDDDLYILVLIYHP